MKHPHAELFIAIADGESIDDFEAKREESKSFIPAVQWIKSIVLRPERVTVRRKQKTITVKGFQVPEPCKEIPVIGNLYAPSLFATHGYAYIGQAFSGDANITNALKNGVLHTSQAAAAAHAKALLGIDPNAKPDDSVSDNWITWTGGKCPVAAAARVAVKFRNGTTGQSSSPETQDWAHCNSWPYSDIVAYKLL